MKPANRWIAIATLTAIVAGCGAGGATGSPPGASPSAIAPTAMATAASSPFASGSPSIDVPVGGTPPVAMLAAEGGDAVAGELGSHVWFERGSDAPWLPGAPITVGAGEPLTVRLEPHEEIVAWRARYVPADQGDPLGARSLGEGTSVPAFPAPEAGSWTAEVSVDLGPDVGSASYFWRLDVR